MENKKFGNVYVIYHKEDNDGVFSAAIASHALKDKCKNLDLVPLTYTEINKLADTCVTMKNLLDDNGNTNLLIMLDISMTPKNMEKVYQVWKDNFIWCDHHKPIILASHQKPYTFGNCPGYHDRTDQSALIATYKYFNNMVDDGNISELPYLLQALGVYDSWTHELRGFNFDLINHINYAITYDTQLSVDNVLQDYDFFTSPDWNEDFCKSLAKYGESIEKMKIADVCNILKNNANFAWLVGDDNRPAVAFFSNIKYNSAIYKTALSQVLGDPSSTVGNTNGKNIIVFSNDINFPDKVTMSLYNIDDTDKFDCGAYLKEKYNGGGHVGAGGCVLTLSKAKTIMKNHAI